MKARHPLMTLMTIVTALFAAAATAAGKAVRKEDCHAHKL